MLHLLHTYPRHIEEFEGCREMTPCSSCTGGKDSAQRAVRKLVRFITREDER